MTLRKPVFTKVEKLQPGSQGHNLIVQVMNVGEVMEKVRPSGDKLQIAEVLLADETGAVLFTARNEQIKLFKKGECVTVRNAKVNMVRGFIRLVVDKWGAIKPPGPTEKLQGPPKVENNISNIEYELV
ncbi:hypothetical protein GpartN1_g47.t1 [Galdieria partita]|uniref:Single-stranded DNA binding protein Ssb-like OB fold domain-containing protein n=1 Tax=Galdieria partita TaxID=83374 RepID=A0A9C7PPU5_9RHOD|nr:hypothetical protein GpartN1_g47.t1 [Galdieria partita]